MGESIAKMERFARSHKAPFIAKVYMYGKVRQWQDRDKLLSTLRQYGQGLDNSTQQLGLMIQ